MKKILLFSFILILIPIIIVSLISYVPKNKSFEFTKNTYVRVKRTKTNKIDKVPLEEYVKGVVSGEMPVSFHEEALKAQAVAARSYVMYKIIHNKKKNYDVEDTVLNQVYLDDTKIRKNWGKNYEKNKEKINKVVNDTAYQYITYNGSIANALFFSTSSGYTENSEDIFVSKLSYLKSVKSEWDKESPKYLSTKKYKINDFLKKLQLPVDNKVKITGLKKGTTGRIDSITINNKVFTGKDIVNKLGLKSRIFEISVSDFVYINVKGNGHGVGMSQYGAQGMAKAGYKYQDILKHYYKGVNIEKIK